MGQRKETAVGIDLGTTYSVVAHLDDDGRPVTIANDEGGLTTPSVVFFDRSNTIVGREAIKAAEFEPERVARFAKRDMGERLYHEPILGNPIPPEVIQALILKKVKHDGELRIGSFKKAVVTVPAYFNEPRRKGTQDAGRLAGIDVLDIINEPTAAAIAHGTKQGFLSPDGTARDREVVMVYDLGGGTFDVTLMEIQENRFNALATTGDVHLGGIDWDQRLADMIHERFQDEHVADLRDTAAANEALIEESVRIKHALTARREATVRFAHGGKRVQFQLSRAEFEQQTASLLDRTRMTVARVLKDAGLKWSDVTRMLLVGGSTRMPMVQTMLERESGLKADRSLSPDEAVAHGAAIYAGMLLAGGKGVRQTLVVQDVNSHDLGVMGIDAQTTRPRRRVMIPKNSRLPCKRSSRFKTAERNQRNVAVRVVEGGTDSGHGATLVGKCVVRELPNGLPKGTPVNVVFKYGTDGRLAVRAELPTVSCDAHTIVERAIGMSREEFGAWSQRLSAGLVIEETRSPEEPFDVSEIESLLDDFDGELEFSDEEEETLASKQTTGDSALDDFLDRMS